MKEVTEHQSQCAIFKWARLQQGAIPELGLLFAVPNAGRRGGAVGRQMVNEGLKKGVPDMMLPVARKDWHGLFIELKKEGGKLSLEQNQWLYSINMQGYLAIVCWSSESAIDEIKNYLSI